MCVSRCPQKPERMSDPLGLKLPDTMAENKTWVLLTIEPLLRLPKYGHS